jgi:hypothetical protein
MTNDETYSIHPQDYEQISRFVKGVYNVTKSDDGSAHEMEITEVVLNDPINEATQVINGAIRLFNSTNGSVTKKQKNWLMMKGRSGQPGVFSPLDAAQW